MTVNDRYCPITVRISKISSVLLVIKLFFLFGFYWLSSTYDLKTV